MIQRLDIKTIVILILGAIVVCMAIFGKGGGDLTALETLLKERDEANKVLEQRIAERTDSIEMYKDTAAYYASQDSLHVAVIDALQEIREKQQRDIDFLKSKMKNVAKPIEDATDEKRIEFWRQYFARKGIKP